MNTKQIYKKFTYFANQKQTPLIIDWLSLNLLDTFDNLDFDHHNICEVGDFRLELTDLQTSHHKRLIYIYYKGNKVMELSTIARNKVFLNKRAFLRFDNEVFYSNEQEYLFNLLCKYFDIRDYHIIRIDLAVDGVYLHKWLTNHEESKYLPKKLKDAKGVKKYAKRVDDINNIHMFSYDRSNTICNQYDAFEIGTRGSRREGTKRSPRFIRYYNKTAELEKQNGKKDYIKKYFENHNFNTRDVYRFEISLTHQYLKEKRFTLDQAFNEVGLLNLFRTSLKGFFEFRLNQKKNITRCEDIDMFPKLKKAHIFQRVKRKVLDKVRTIKIAVKRDINDILHKVYQSHDFAQSVYYGVIAKMEKYRLLDWWKKVSPNILYEYQLKCKKQQLEYDSDAENFLFDITDTLIQTNEYVRPTFSNS